MELPQILAISLLLGSPTGTAASKPLADKETTDSLRQVKVECTSVALEYFVGGKPRTTNSRNCREEMQTINEGAHPNSGGTRKAGTGAR